MRSSAEQIAFRVRPEFQGDTLPLIFHYWAVTHLSPDAQRLGIGSPEAFYLQTIRDLARESTQPISILSVGSGAYAMEITLAQTLADENINFHLCCMDLNDALMTSARANAQARGVSGAMRFHTANCNTLSSLPASDVIIVNQFLHHLEALERFCALLSCALKRGGQAFIQTWWDEVVAGATSRPLFLQDHRALHAG